MRVGEINEMLHKTEELKALFVFGQRVIPFLEEIFLFIREVTPLLENINASIEENLSKMPKAAQQLSSVTKATELATTEILDTLDGLSYKSDVISSNMKQLISIQRQNRDEHEKIISAVNQLQKDELMATEDKNSVYSRIIDVVRKIEKREGGESSTYHIDNIRHAIAVLQKPEVSEELVSNSEKLLESIRMDSTQIMMSLQVQDITSQQLAAVNSLLQTVQNRLSEIMIHFRNTEIGELISSSTSRRPAPSSISVNDDTATKVSSLHREIAYDHDVGSALNNDPSRQEQVDAILSGFQQIGGSGASQNDIDALFGSVADNDANTNANNSTASSSVPSSTPSTAPPPSAASTTVTPTASGERTSQNDIDALFGSAGDAKDVASQDDIDALFK
jgi:chemotaxis regulatin CheY-phosphate phosphatase CheZ